MTLGKRGANRMAISKETFGPVISSYSRAQAIEDGVLVDLTEWGKQGGKDGMLRGFTCSVAVTAAVWGDIENIPPKESHQDVRGRAHDVLCMAYFAVARAPKGSSILVYSLHMDINRNGRRTKLQRYKVVAGPGDNHEMVITIMQPHED